MDKRLWLAGFSLGLLLSASACSEVDHCEFGAEGCQGGPCIDDTECKFDLDCVEEVGSGNPVCGKEEELGVYNCGEDVECVDNGGDGDGDGTTTTPCNCTGIDQLCVPGTMDQCVNYCEDPGFLVSVDDRRNTQQLPCRNDSNANPVPYADACKATWRQFCLRAEAYCDGYVCAPELLGSGTLPADAQKWCTDNFPVFDGLASYCENLRDSTCESFPECPAANPQTCKTPFVCNSTCPENPTFANDGACDDGDIATAAFADCAWGTDCGDCGPRTGTAPVVPIKIGAPCVSNSQCQGNSEDLRRNESWCLAVMPGNGAHRCMGDCTRDGVCPEGYECVGIEDGNGKPITQGDLEAGVCNPMICQ